MVGFYLFNVALLEICCGLSHILKGEKHQCSQTQRLQLTLSVRS